MEDEEVIFEGSCLHQYLTEIGYSDFEVVESQKKYGLFKQESSSQNSSIKEKNHFWSLVPFPKDVVAKFLEGAFASVIFSKLINEEDMQILELFSPTAQSILTSVNLTGETHLNLVSKLTFPSSLLTFHSPISHHTTSLVFSFFLWSLSCVLFWSIFGSFHSAIIAFILTGIAIALMAVLFKLFYWWKLQNYLSQLSKNISLFKESFLVINSSLKYLNEINIIKNGLSRGGLYLDSASQSYEQQLTTHVDTFLRLLSNNLQGCHDRLSRTPGHQELSVIFNSRFEDSSSLYHNGLKVTFSELKSRREIIARLCSSVFTETLICVESSQMRSFPLILSAKHINIIEANSRLVEKTLRLYKFVYRIGGSRLDTVAAHVPASTPKSKLKNLVISCDALSIHSRLLVHSSMALRELVERFSSSDDCEDERNHFLGDLEIKISEVKSELSSCNGCFGELVERISDLKDKIPTESPPLEPQASNDVQNLETEAGKLPPKTVECGLRDPVIEDEVFEAVVTEEVLQGNPRGGKRLNKSKQLQNGDHSSKRKDKERCKRLLQEIQPVLMKRREMWAEREEKALRRMRGGNMDGLRHPMGKDGECFEDQHPPARDGECLTEEFFRNLPQTHSKVNLSNVGQTNLQSGEEKSITSGACEEKTITSGACEEKSITSGACEEKSITSGACEEKPITFGASSSEACKLLEDEFNSTIHLPSSVDLENKPNLPNKEALCSSSHQNEDDVLSDLKDTKSCKSSANHLPSLDTCEHLWLSGNSTPNANEELCSNESSSEEERGSQQQGIDWDLSCSGHKREKTTTESFIGLPSVVLDSVLGAGFVGRRETDNGEEIFEDFGEIEETPHLVTSSADPDL